MEEERYMKFKEDHDMIIETRTDIKNIRSDIAEIKGIVFDHKSFCQSIILKNNNDCRDCREKFGDRIEAKTSNKYFIAAFTILVGVQVTMLGFLFRSL